MVTFGQTLRAHRVALSVTPSELAKLCGWSRIQVHRIEASESVSEKTVQRYAAGLGLAPALELRPIDSDS